MKIEFSPKSMLQLSLLSELGSRETGFLFGTDTGKYKIVDGILPVRFNGNSINRIYAQVFNRYKNGLIGVFFINNQVFLSDWFLEGLILEVQNKSSSVHLCRFDNRHKKIGLVPLSEIRRG